MVFMNAEQLEAEALKLDPEVRARLAERLFLSLDPIAEEEWREIWAAEAERRDTQMTADPSLGVPGDEVFRKARARLK
jgi:putative addiction module component (TIGR02574 family)